MNKKIKNEEIDAANALMKVLDKIPEHLAIIKAATDECDKLSFFADVNRAEGKEQFAKGLYFAVKHILDAMSETIKRYEKEGR